jgi:hypothetical protein
MGVAYSDKLQWAIYSPNAGKIRHNELQEAPESEGLADGFGVRYTPFFHPGEEVIQHCSRLADWWVEVQKKRSESMGNVQQIEASVPSQRPRREHRLIADTTPTTQPDGYFDCTVEVCCGFLLTPMLLDYLFLDTSNLPQR